MTDEKIIDLLFKRSDFGLRELDIKYGKLCRRVSCNILSNKSDVEECVNDAYLGIWNSVPPTTPNPLVAYLCKIVRNTSLKRYFTNTAKKRNSSYDVALSEIEAFVPSSNTIESEIEAKELACLIESFLDTLTEENRVIFMCRYWFFDTYEDIAEHVGLSEKNISVRLTRIRKQMRRYLVKGGIFL